MEQQHSEFFIQISDEKQFDAPKVQYEGMNLQILFQQEYPLSLDDCRLSVANGDRSKGLKINESKSATDYQSANQQCTFNQPFIQIVWIDPSQTMNSYGQQCVNRVLTLIIPMESVLCLGKKSPASTLIMLKDQQKLVQTDQNGYELVSDSQDEQQYQQKTNPVHKAIKDFLQNRLPNSNSSNPRNYNMTMFDVNRTSSSIQKQVQVQDNSIQVEANSKLSSNPSNSQNYTEKNNQNQSKLKMNQKCNIVLTIKQRKDHTNLNSISPLTQSSVNTSKHCNFSDPPQVFNLYSFLSKELQEYQKLHHAQSNQSGLSYLNPRQSEGNHHKLHRLQQEQQSQGQQIEEEYYQEEEHLQDEGYNREEDFNSEYQAAGTVQIQQNQPRGNIQRQN